ncbi:cytochrome P450 [Granulicella sibirica]|uniref:Cytochrome P450 n=1 Tax=Granulicella sibirica TaxID=2479048 RepID=A0A4Q0T0I8_9BACT|nr:cytochrome P450 [Granulicella sibirica]RXH57103.1 cytochrome P450 [Granulicella sibirica]
MDHAPDIRLQPGKTIPVGPSFWPRLLRRETYQQDAAAFLLHNAQTFGDLIYFEAFGRPILQFNHPDLIQEMLVRDAPHHHRNLVMQRSKAVLGEGLLTSEEPLHMRQRRLAQPAFHRQRIGAYGEIIAGYTEKMTALWATGTTLDVRAEMLLLALRIVGKTLFDTDVEHEVHSIAAAVDSFQGFLPLAFLPLSTQIQRLPLPAMRRIRRGREELDTLIYRMIRERRADPRDRGDLLSMLIASVDEEDPTASMTDRQVRDECLTVLLAGHETTANALSFALWLLAQHQEIQQQLAQESAAALEGRQATAADYPKLPLAEQVFAEALRLYPPVWVTARTAAENYEYRGMTIKKGTMLVAPQFAVHRDPRFYVDPLAFAPARFTSAIKATRPRYAYFPFGAGSRQCIGEGLAWMEGVLILATIAQMWRLSPVPGGPNTIAISPSVSLRPKGPVLLHVERRTR